MTGAGFDAGGARGSEARATSAPEPSGRPALATARRGEPQRLASAPARDLANPSASGLLAEPQSSGLLQNPHAGMPGTMEALLDRTAPARLLSSTAEAWGRESSRNALPPLSPFAETEQQVPCLHSFRVAG